MLDKCLGYYNITKWSSKWRILPDTKRLIKKMKEMINSSQP